MDRRLPIVQIYARERERLRIAQKNDRKKAKERRQGGANLEKRASKDSWKHKELEALRADTLFQGTVSNKNSHMKRFLIHLRVRGIKEAEAKLIDVEEFGLMMARDGHGKQVCRSYMGTVVQCWKMQKRVDCDTIFLEWPERRAAVYRIAEYEEVTQAPIMTGGLFGQLSVNTQEVAAQILALGLRMASARGVDDGDYTRVGGRFPALQIKELKTVPESCGRTALLRCNCKVQGAGDRNCPKCSQVRLSKDKIAQLNKEFKKIGMREHSLRRTTAVIVKRLLVDVLKLEESEKIMKKVYKLMAWKFPKVAKPGKYSLFNRYTRGWQAFPIADLPPVTRVIIRTMFG